MKYLRTYIESFGQKPTPTEKDMFKFCLHMFFPMEFREIKQVLDVYSWKTCQEFIGKYEAIMNTSLHPDSAPTTHSSTVSRSDITLNKIIVLCQEFEPPISKNAEVTMKVMRVLNFALYYQEHKDRTFQGSCEGYELAFQHLLMAKTNRFGSDTSLETYKSIFSLGGRTGGLQASKNRKETRKAFIDAVIKSIQDRYMWNDLASNYSSLADIIWHEIQDKHKHQKAWSGFHKEDFKRFSIGKKTVLEAVKMSYPN